MDKFSLGCGVIVEVLVDPDWLNGIIRELEAGNYILLQADDETNSNAIRIRATGYKDEKRNTLEIKGHTCGPLYIGSPNEFN